MKIRLGFVSNSSTSSFVCEICGHQEAGSDSVGMDEYGFIECVNNHTICMDEALEGLSEIEHGETEECEEYPYAVPEKYCPICNFHVLSQKDMRRYFLKESGISEAEVFEEVKKFNKRRKKLYDAEYVRYVMEKKKIFENDLIAELKGKFSTYSEFLESIHNEVVK